MKSLVVLLALLIGSAAQAALPSLALCGTALTDVMLTPEHLADFERQAIEVVDHGTPARFEGVWLADVLKAAGLPKDGRLPGADMNLFLLVSAADGYRATFAVAELDPGIGNRKVLLADRRDGQPLSPAHGPYRLIVPGDARAARWVRQVVRLEVLRPGAAETQCSPAP